MPITFITFPIWVSSYFYSTQQNEEVYHVICILVRFGCLFVTKMIAQRTPYPECINAQTEQTIRKYPDTFTPI